MPAPAIENTPSTDTVNPGSASTGTITGVVVPSKDYTSLFVCVGIEGNGTPGDVTVSSITYGGVNLTRFGAANGPTWGRAEWWYLKSPAAGTANVVVTLSSADSFIAGAYVVSNVDPNVFIYGSLQDGSNAALASNSLNSASALDLLIDVLHLDATGHNPGPGSGETEQWDLTSGTAIEVASYTQPGTSGIQMNHSWTTACDYVHYIIGIRGWESKGGRNLYDDFPKLKLRG